MAADLKKPVVRKDSPQTMGNSVIILPTIKNGTIALGDLWDCRSSTVVGNLFAKPLKRKHLEAHPISSLKYSLSRVKDARDFVAEFFVSVSLALDCAGGAVKIAGSASFDREERKKFHQEMLLCNYDLRTYEVRLLPNATEIKKTRDAEDVDKDEDDDEDVMSFVVKEQLENGSLDATHYVQSITLGGHAQASITYYENIDKNHMHLTGSLEGTIEVGPVTASAKASLELLDSNNNEAYSTEISVTAQPRIKAAPTNCEDMFTEIENLDKVIDDEAHFPQLDTPERKITGIPLRFRLVPLNRIVTLDAENDTYKILKEEILSAYADMMLTLEDYSFQDYLKQLLKDQVPSIVPILQDEGHPLTQELAKLAVEVMIKALALKNDAFLLFTNFKYGLATETELSNFLGRYNTELPLFDIANEISEIGLRARKELADIRSSDIVHIVDAEGRPSVHFFMNKSSLDEWWMQEKTIKILLQTNPTYLDGSSTPNGIFQKLFEMSAPLKSKLGVEIAVAFPSISLDFSVSLKTRGMEIKMNKNEEITFAVDLFRMATDTGGGDIFALFFSLNAELSSLQIPLKAHVLEEFSTFLNIMETYLPLGGNAHICETQVHLLATLGGTLDSWNFVFPLEAVHRGIDMMVIYRKFRGVLSDSGIKHAWIFSKFNILGKYSGPLMFVFRDDMLHSICYDTLDVATLVHCLLEGEGFNWDPISVGIGRTSSLYIEQWNYATEIVPNCILDQSTRLSQQIGHHDLFPPNLNPTLQQALVVLRPLTLRKDLQVVNRIANLALDGSDYYLELEYILVQRANWADNEIGSSEVDWLGLSTDTLALMQTSAPHLVLAYSTLGELKELARTPPPPEPEEPEDPEIPELEEPEEPEEPDFNSIMHTEINKMIEFLTKMPPPAGLHPLARSVLQLTQIEYPDWNTRIKKNISAFEVFLLDESSGPEFFHLFQLSQVASQMSAEGSISGNPIPLSKTYCDRVKISEDEYPGIEEKLQKYLEQGQLFQILKALDSITVHSAFHTLHKEFSLIDSLPAPLNCKSVLEKMMFYSEELQIVWENPKFLHLLRTCLSNGGVIDTLYSLLVQHSKDNVLPYYVPQDIAEKITPFFGQEISPGPKFPWEREWKGNIQKFIDQLKIFVAKLTVPSDFQQVFHENLIKNGTLEDALLEKKCLFYWDTENQLFSHSWTLFSVKTALARLAELDNNNSGKKSTLLKLKSHDVLTPVGPKQYLEVAENWLPFVENGKLELISNTTFNTISRTALLPPKLSYNHSSQTSIKIMPYILNSIKTRNISGILLPSVISGLIDYPTPGKFPGQINFGPDYEIPEPSKRILFSCNDFCTAVLQSSDGIVIHEILQNLIDSGNPVPLMVPSIMKRDEETGMQFIWMQPALECVLVPRSTHSSPQIIPRNHFFSLNLPYRFVLTLRVGDVSQGDPGRSSFLNRYLLQGENRKFGSLFEEGSKFGRSLSRTLTLEFIPLTETTCQPQFYDQLRETVHQSGEPILLGVLHGNLAQEKITSEIWDQILPNISSIVVFWKMKNWKILKETKALLFNNFKTVPILDVVLYPDPTIVDNIRDENLLFPIPKASVNPDLVDRLNAAKLRRIINEAMEYTTVQENVTLKNSASFTPAETISTLESLEFLAIIMEHSLPKVKGALLRGMNDPLGIEVIQAFLKIVYQPEKEIRHSALYHLLFELDHLSEVASWEIRRKIKTLRNQVHLNPANQEQLGIQIKVHLEKLDKTIINVTDLFTAAGLFILSNSSDPAIFCQTLADSILSSFPIQIEDIFHPEFFPLFQTSMSLIPGNIRIFVVSTLGMKASGKSTLLNHLYGGEGFSEWSSSSGIMLKLIWLQEEFRSELECDAFLVLDSEGVGDPENEGEIVGQFLERRLATLLLSCSDFTLVNISSGNNTINPLISILESSLINILAKIGDEGKENPSKIQKPDIQIICHSQNELENIQKFSQTISSSIGNLAQNHLLDLGLLSKESTRLVQLHTRSFQEKLFIPFPSYEDKDAFHKAVSKLKQHIENKCVQTRSNIPGRLNFHSWFENCKEIWDQQLRPETKKEVILDIDSGSESVKKFQSIMATKLAISEAFIAHETRLKPNFMAQIDDLFTNEEEFTPGFDSKVNLILNQIAKDLLPVINTCEAGAQEKRKTRSGNVNPNSCDLCREAFFAREELFQILQDSKSKSFLIVEDITSHTNLLRYQTYQGFSQEILKRMIKSKKSEELSNIVNNLINQFPSNPESVFSHFLQHISNLQYLPGAKELFHLELELVFGTLQKQCGSSLPAPFSRWRQF